MITQGSNEDTFYEKKLPNNLILEILDFLKPNKIGQCLILNKSINSRLSLKFHTVNFSVNESDNIIMYKKEISKDSLLKNVKISVLAKHENKKNILLMLQIHKNEKDRLGVIPLIFNKKRDAFVISINENKYSSLFYLLRSKNFETMKFKVELVTKNYLDVSVSEIILSMLYFNNRTYLQ